MWRYKLFTIIIAIAVKLIFRYLIYNCIMSMISIVLNYLVNIINYLSRTKKVYFYQKCIDIYFVTRTSSQWCIIRQYYILYKSTGCVIYETIEYYFDFRGKYESRYPTPPYIPKLTTEANKNRRRGVIKNCQTSIIRIADFILNCRWIANSLVKNSIFGRGSVTRPTHSRIIVSADTWYFYKSLGFELILVAIKITIIVNSIIVCIINKYTNVIL